MRSALLSICCIFLTLTLVAEPSKTHHSTIALKPGQSHIFEDMPQRAHIDLKSNFPVNVRFGDCRLDTVTSFAEDCDGKGNSLVIVDARNPGLILGRYNSVEIAITAIH
jgi:hypothetical protein